MILNRKELMKIADIGKSKRRWFIYRDENKKEILSIRDYSEFIDIILNLKNYMERRCLDIADRERLVDAIQSSSPDSVVWPRNHCLNAFNKAVKKYIKTVKKPENRINADDRFWEAFYWTLDYKDLLERFCNIDISTVKANARIQCNMKIREQIKDDVYAKLIEAVNLLSDPERERRDVHVLENENELLIIYPVGEIYGCSSEYVKRVERVFADLKMKYPAITISGLVYEYETISPTVYGCYFFCDNNDKELHSTYDPQECDVNDTLMDEFKCIIKRFEE